MKNTKAATEKKITICEMRLWFRDWSTDAEQQWTIFMVSCVLRPHYATLTVPVLSSRHTEFTGN